MSRDKDFVVAPFRINQQLKVDLEECRDLVANKIGCISNAVSNKVLLSALVFEFLKHNKD